MMKNSLKVLITGCGGDIGQSIGKILKSKPGIFSLVIGADLHEEHAGKFIFDACFVLPRCNADGYQAAVNQLIQEHQIDIVIPISEPELRHIEKQQYQDNFFGKPVIMANNKSLQIGFDKKLTADFLAQHGLPFPYTQLISANHKSHFPVLIKSRDGSGGKSIHVVKSQEEMNLFQKIYPEFIVQEYLSNEEGEYTCGLFRSSSGEIRDIILKRKLMGGFSGFGTREEHSDISQLLHKIAILLDLRGSINVQLRLVQGTPVTFEINPRFSSTVLFRHLMGYEDVLWSIQDKMGWPLDAFQINHSISKFYKGFSEYVD
jgi:carbamoyl-phosphate synthase large subunit